MATLLDDQVLHASTAASDASVMFGVKLSPIPCAYCWEPIPANAFVFWSQAKRILSAPCPCCDRRMTLTPETWLHWSRAVRASSRPEPAAAVAVTTPGV
jgi:hypothetical protein